MNPGDIFNPWQLFVGLFIPNALARFPGLSSSAKMTYGRLAQYAGRDGACYPTQKDLAEETGLTERHVGRMIRELEHHGFIRADRPQGRDRLFHRHTSYVFLWHDVFSECVRSGQDKLSGPSETNCPVLYNELKENHPKENHTAKAARTKQPFVSPSLTDIKSYCLEQKNSVDPQRFLDYYTSNGWRVGRNPMKDWRAAVRTWERREPAARSGGHARPQRPGDRCEDLRKYDRLHVEVLP